MLHSFYEKLKKDTSFKTAVYIFLLALFIVSLFKNPVNRLIVYKLLPKEEVSIILDQPSELTLKTDDVRMTLPSSVDRLLYETETEGGKYCAVFQMTRLPEQYLLLEIKEETESVSFRIGDGLEEEHVFTEEERNAGTYKIYPFADSYLKLALSLVIYFGAGVLLYCFFLFCHVRLQERKLFSATIWDAEYKHPYIWFFAVWAIIYGIGMWQYIFQVGTPHYIPDNAYGDQSGYWAAYLFDGAFFDFSIRFATFHGYCMLLIPTIAKAIGNLLSVDPVKVYLLFPSFIFSLLITLTIPRLYTYISGKKARVVSVVVFGAIIVYFWDSYVIGVLTDMYAAALFFSVIAYFIKAYKEKSLLFSSLLGFSAAIMINIRLNFLYATVILVLGLLLFRVFSHHRSDRERLNGLGQKDAKKYSKKKLILCVLVFLFCFLLICAPQAVYNYQRGHIGIFPYDAEDSFNGHYVTWNGWNTFLWRGMVLHPAEITDDQLSSMKYQLYNERWLVLHPAQALDVYANSPIETVICLFKKTFATLDIKTNVNYADSAPWRETSGMIFSFVNYLILLIGLYVLLYDKQISQQVKRASWLIFIGTFSLGLMSHCEWRSGLAFYILLSYMFAFHFMGEIICEPGNYRTFCRSSFYRYVSFGELLCFGISMTLWA